MRGLGESAGVTTDDIKFCSKDGDYNDIYNLRGEDVITIWYLAHSSPGCNSVYDFRNEPEVNNSEWCMSIHDATQPLCTILDTIVTRRAGIEGISVKCWICWSSLPKITANQRQNDNLDLFTGPHLGRRATFQMLKGLTNGLIQRYAKLNDQNDCGNWPVARKIHHKLMNYSNRFNGIPVTGYPGNLLSGKPGVSALTDQLNANDHALFMRWGWIDPLDQRENVHPNVNIDSTKQYHGRMCLKVHAESLAITYE